jgi:hypothetical protein
MAVKRENLKIGDKVYYQPDYSHKFEIGIVKEIGITNAHVVYHCGEDWFNYRNYTGALTAFRDLHHGWEPEEVKINNFLKKYAE